MTMTSHLPAYSVTRKRVKHMRITVRPPHGEVRVTAPLHVADQVIAAFVASKLAWIAKHAERTSALPPPLQAGPEAERLRAKLREDVPPLLGYWADRMGLEVPPFTLRRMTTRWGSCNTQTRRITLSLELGRRDQELLEYVIVHELAHLFERGHNEKFYAVMDAHLPDWRAKRKQLNRR